MYRFTNRNFSWNTFSIPVLVFLWCFGYSSGFCLPVINRAEHREILQALIHNSNSLFGSLCASVIPFLLSALFVHLGVPFFLLPISFVKSFIDGYSHICILSSFSRSGWLVSLLFLFSQSVSNVILIHYWVRNINCAGKQNIVRLIHIFLICFFVCAFEHFGLRPFLSDLLK